jgi:DinB superfamily
MPRLKFTASETQGYLMLLAESARRIQDCIAGFDDEQLSLSLQEGEWSPALVLGHLRACADVWSNSIYAMLAQEHPNLPDTHPRRWAKNRGYLQAMFHPSLTVFLMQRQELLDVLRSLPFEDWSRSAAIGRHTHNIFSQVRRMAKHEAEHCAELEAELASRREAHG